MEEHGISKDNIAVAHKERDFIGGQPKITRAWDDCSRKKVDIFKSIHVPQKGVQTCATIGLSDTNIGLVNEGKSLRVELVGACDVRVEEFQSILATTAFEVMDVKRCYPGCIVPNVIKLYIPTCEMKHVLLTDPFMWEEADVLILDDKAITWLMLVPISDQEYEYARDNGVEALEQIFEEKGIDIFNMWRKSVI